MSERVRCSAKTAKGKRCKRYALEGTDPAVCVSHAGLAGRKSLLDEDVENKLVALLRSGNYLEVALAAVGVGKSTFYDWLDRGDPGGTDPADAPYRDFRSKIDHARAEGEARMVAVVAAAAPKDWKAAAWMLERQFPERWARPSGRHPADGDAGAGSKPAGNPFDALDEAVVDLTAQREARRGSR